MKGVVILGSTGSVGRQALEVIRSFEKKFRIVGLIARTNHHDLLNQVHEFNPPFAALTNESAANIGTASWITPNDLVKKQEVDIVIVAIPGLEGLLPTLTAISHGKTIALASKEILVVAGQIITEETIRSDASILPLDSEHSAIWQCLAGEEESDIRRLILTASGGPFRQSQISDLLAVKPEQALAHPTWKMGPKVTIDSATLMNKGFEVLEAHWLYNIPYEKIDVVVHPESIIHSLVEFEDKSLKAQLSYPDMRLPIQYALSYPERWANESIDALDLTKLSKLTFENVDEKRFPCFRLARQAGEMGATFPAVLQSADEIAVELFLEGELDLPTIPEYVNAALEAHSPKEDPSIEDILDADKWARSYVLTHHDNNK